MVANREQMRNEAKKIYKEQIKANKVPKGKRLPFSEFYKKYKEHLLTKAKEDKVEEVKEDFNFDDMVSFNNSTEVVVDEPVNALEHIPAEFFAPTEMPNEPAECQENCDCKKENI